MYVVGPGILLVGYNNWYWYNINSTNVLCKELGYTTTQCKIFLRDF